MSSISRREAVGLLAGAAAAVAGGKALALPETKRRMMMSVYSPANKLFELSAEGAIVWEHTYPSLVVMFEPLANGNVMYAYAGKPTGVQEVNRENKVVWDYVSTCEEILGFTRLPNGNVLVGEQGPCRAVEVNRGREIVRAVPLTTQEKGAHRQVRHIRPVAGGGFLVCHEGDSTVREYDKDGNVVWEYKGVPNVFEAMRLKNGNTLISSNPRVTEVNKAGETVWELTRQDAPDIELTWPTSIQPLKNGNLIVADFKRDAQGKGAHAFEVTRDKKIVWTYADHSAVKILTCVHVF